MRIAVGTYDNLYEWALAKWWDGNHWSTQSLPQPTSGYIIAVSAVSCTTVTTYTAVGWRSNDLFAAHWTCRRASEKPVHRVHHNGAVEFDVTVPYPGQLDVLETNWAPSTPKRTHAVLLQPGPDRYAFARRHLGMARPGTLHMTIRPSATGARQIRHHYRPVRINLWVTYQPTGGAPDNAAFINLFVTR